MTPSPFGFMDSSAVFSLMKNSSFQNMLTVGGCPQTNYRRSIGLTPTCLWLNGSDDTCMDSVDRMLSRLHMKIVYWAANASILL